MEADLASSIEIQDRPAVEAASKSLRVLILKLVALVVWLVLGAGLAWLVHDFGVSAGFGEGKLASLLIFALFAVSCFLISMLSWNTYRVANGKASWLSQPTA